MVWLPPGLAHGFVVTSESADFLYKTTAYYAPEAERCIRWNDPDLAIDWPALDVPLPLQRARRGSAAARRCARTCAECGRRGRVHYNHLFND